MKMMINAIEYQTNIVLNFSLSVGFRFAIAEPIVKTTIAVSIKAICINPKNVKSKYCKPFSVSFQKYFTIGLCV